MKSSNLLKTLSASLCIVSLAQAQSASTPSQQKNDPTPPPMAPLGACPQGATNLCVPLDGSFQVVTFDGVGGNGPALPGDPCQRNDDDVTLAVNLQFNFDLFGQTFNQVFINNNGNVSFGASFSTFTSTGFPVNGFPMVAPFWADVDTRALTSGVVYYKSELHRLIVIWDHVGYYNTHADKLNTFELIISDGLDPDSGLGNNVCFCYDDMQWTTGDASGGTGGFGGTPATVGVNKGDGVNFFQIGRFGVAGAAYDGPGGATDGVDYLDNSTFCFSVGQQGNNVAPVYLNPPTTCLQVPEGAPYVFNIQAIGPEIAQTVNITVNSGGLANFSSNAVAGNPAVITCTFRPDSTQLGQHNIIFTATDNFNPPASTLLTVCLEVVPAISTFCLPHTPGTINCPCRNPGTGTTGCNNSDETGGAQLFAAGSPSIGNDSLVFSTTGEKATALSIVLQGTTQNGGVVFGQGVLCIGGNLVRLYVKTAVGGSITAPAGGDPSVSTRSAALGDVLSLGTTRYHQVYYRDPFVNLSLCPETATFNATQALSVVWGH